MVALSESMVSTDRYRRPADPSRGTGAFRADPVSPSQICSTTERESVLRFARVLSLQGSPF